MKNLPQCRPAVAWVTWTTDNDRYVEKENPASAGFFFVLNMPRFRSAVQARRRGRLALRPNLRPGLDHTHRPSKLVECVAIAREIDASRRVGAVLESARPVTITRRQAICACAHSPAAASHVAGPAGPESCQPNCQDPVEQPRRCWQPSLFA